MPRSATTMFGIANVGKPVASAWAMNPPPNRIPPTPSSRRRETRRVSSAKLSWTIPDANAPIAARNAIVSTPTPNSSMMARNISGNTTAWAWLTAWATDSRTSERVGRIRESVVTSSMVPHHWPRTLGQPARCITIGFAAS